MTAGFDDQSEDLLEEGLEKCIGHHLQQAERHCKKCYFERRHWQLQQFSIGYRQDWSHHELLLAIKTRYRALCRLQTQNPMAAGLLLLPMIRAAYDVEISAANSRQTNTV